VIGISPKTEEPTEFHIGEELTVEQRDNFRSLLYDDVPELLHPVNSPHVSRQWDQSIETTSPMKRQHLNRLSLAERAELNRKLKDAMEATLILPNHSEIGSTFFLYGKLMTRCDCAVTTVGLMESRKRMPTHFRVWTTH
jgi:hypothetical protein